MINGHKRAKDFVRWKTQFEVFSNALRSGEQRQLESVAEISKFQCIDMFQCIAILCINMFQSIATSQYVMLQ